MQRFLVEVKSGCGERAKRKRGSTPKAQISEPQKKGGVTGNHAAPGTAKADPPPLRPCAFVKRGHAVLPTNGCQAHERLTLSDAGERRTGHASRHDSQDRRNLPGKRRLESSRHSDHDRAHRQRQPYAALFGQSGYMEAHPTRLAANKLSGRALRFDQTLAA